ncbi:MAG: hypothetical protein IKA02_06510, partial [Clostridia bacterium]|nr:hypothetical protein [Clostridia bacterium]
IALSIFGLMMAIVTKFLAKRNGINLSLYYVAGVVAILLYAVVLYVNFWEKGASDKIRVDGGRMKLNIYNGLWLSFLANVPTVIFGIFATINCYVQNDFTGILAAISPLYNGMYTIFTDTQGLALGTYFPPVFIFLCVPALIISFVSYILGVKGYKCLFPEPKKQQNKNRE